MISSRSLMMSTPGPSDWAADSPGDVWRECVQAGGRGRGRGDGEQDSGRGGENREGREEKREDRRSILACNVYVHVPQRGLLVVLPSPSPVGTV